MHPIQQKLLALSANANLAELTLRQMAARIGLPAESPQKIKHHLQQLQRKGLVRIDRAGGTMSRAPTTPVWVTGPAATDTRLFSIPIVGAANCGPATLFAEENLEGILRVSGKLVRRPTPRGLYALKADGASMNRADIGGRSIDDGDFVIIDSLKKSPSTNDIVVVVIDGKATIKRFIDDRANGQIVLRSDSSLDCAPIHLHPEDDFTISGMAIAVIKKAAS